MHPARVTGLSEMVVEPAEEDLVRWEGQKVGQLLARLQQTCKSRTILEVDLGEETNADNLPQETKDKMWLALHQVLCPDVDDVAADGTGRVEGQGLVLVDGIGVEFAVDGTLVDGTGDGRVDEFAVEWEKINNESSPPCVKQMFA